MSKSNNGRVDQKWFKDRVLSLQVRDAALQPVLTSFKQHVENIVSLHLSPYKFLSYGYEETAWFSFFAERAKVDEIKEHSDFDDFWQQTVKIVKEVAKTVEAQKEFTHHLWETAKRHLSELTKDRTVREALRLIQHMTLLLSWTSFARASISVTRKPLIMRLRRRGIELSP